LDERMPDAGGRRRRSLEADPRLRVRWQGRFSHICVDEFQDVDAAPLRLARIVAEPERNLFLGVTTTSRSSEFAHTAPPTHGCRRVRAKIVE
jgi:hypothetical protein